MRSFFVGLIFLSVGHAMAAQCTAATPAPQALQQTYRGGAFIKTALVAPRAPAVLQERALSVSASTDDSTSKPTGPATLFATLIFMSGMVLRRYSAGRR